MIQDEIEKGTRDYIGCGSSSNPWYRLILLRVSFRNKRNNSSSHSALSSTVSSVLCLSPLTKSRSTGRRDQATVCDLSQVVYLNCLLEISHESAQNAITL